MPQLSEDKNNEPTPASRLDLDKIYPTPKSFDELARDREEADDLHAQRAPKHVILLIAIKIYGVLISFFLALNISFGIIPANIIAGVFFSFLMGLICLGLSVWMIASVSSSFQRLGFSAEPFFQIYAVCYSILAGAIYYLTAHISLGIFLALATCLHFILVYGFLRTKLKSS